MRKESTESTYGLGFINSLVPAKYNYRSDIKEYTDFQGDPNKIYFGVMAQDIEAYLISQNNTPSDFNILNYNSNGYMSINYNELIGPLVKSVQELSQRIKKLEEKLND